MPNDAKLGMAAGLALVIVVALFFVHKDVPTSSAATRSAQAQAQPVEQTTGQPDSPPQPPASDEKSGEAESVTVAAPKKPENDQGP